MFHTWTPYLFTSAMHANTSLTNVLRATTVLLIKCAFLALLHTRQRVMCTGTGAVAISCEFSSHPWQMKDKGKMISTLHYTLPQLVLNKKYGSSEIK